MKSLKFFILVNIAAIAIFSFLLAACSGGGSSSSPSTGVVNASLTDGPGDDYDHVWVTVKAISFHTDPNAVWSSTDATWQTTTLAVPVTLDLANLTNGGLNQVFSGMRLPAGTYRQIRLFLAGFDDTLTASASADSLLYNDQVDYTDSSNVAHHVPLEIAYPVQGIQLNGTFNVAEGSTLNLAIDFDLEHDLVPFLHGTQNYYTMKPNLRYFDLNQAGAIIGNVNSSQLCATSVASTCAYNMIVKAEILSADGSRHLDTRATRVASDGSFVLYPLPSGASYDVLIRGRNVETMLVKGVTAPVNSTPTSGAAVLSTSALPIQLTINSAEFYANFSTALTPSTSGYAVFQETLPSTTVPYEVRWGNTNPYTGLLQIPMALSTGQIHVASYTSGAALSFSSETPSEGLGGYSVATSSLPLVYYNLSSPIVISGNSGTNTVVSPLLFSPPSATMISGVTAGTVSGNITQTTSGTYNTGYLVMSRFANIIDTINISSTLAANSGAFSVTLPAGTSSALVPGAYYYGYLRVWNSASPATTMRVYPITTMIDLRSANTVTGLSVTVP